MSKQNKSYWESILSNDFPECTLVKTRNWVSDVFVEDNPEIFEDSDFILKFESGINYDDWSYIIFYFLFKKEGVFLTADENITDCFSHLEEEKEVKKFLKYCRKEEMNLLSQSWEKGCKKVGRIIEYLSEKDPA